MTSAIKRYYDPSTDEFISVDPDTAWTRQPYLLTDDEPLGLTDPLGLRIQGTGTASCGIEKNVTYCNGQTAGGDSAVGVIVTVPTVGMNTGIGTVTVGSTVAISGSDQTPTITVDGEGNATITEGSTMVTFSSGTAAIGATMGDNGSSAFSINSDGTVSATVSAAKSISPFAFDATTTATLYPQDGPTPPPEFGEALAGASVLTTFGLWWQNLAESTLELCAEEPEVCLAAGT